MFPIRGGVDPPLAKKVDFFQTKCKKFTDHFFVSSPMFEYRGSTEVFIKKEKKVDFCPLKGLDGGGGLSLGNLST